MLIIPCQKPERENVTQKHNLCTPTRSRGEQPPVGVHHECLQSLVNKLYTREQVFIVAISYFNISCC